MNRYTSRLKRIFALALALTLLASLLMLSACGSQKKEIVILTSAEDYRIEYMERRMAEEFPEYNVVFEYKGSGSHAAYLKASGKDADCHITHNLEYGYLAELDSLGLLAELSGDFDFTRYADEVLFGTTYLPQERNGGGIIVNLDVISERGLDIPNSYEDLLDEQYKGLISMPNPASSGTGYMFLLSLVNAWGEEEALAYFDALSKNVLSFTTSGSGPVNALVTKEVAIGLGMTAIAVNEINEGTNLEILYFDEGSPYSLYGQAVLAGYESDPDVMRVFTFLATTLTEENNALFFPEEIFKDVTPTVENYPSPIRYADMSNNTPERKEALLAKWKY